MPKYWSEVSVYFCPRKKLYRTWSEPMSLMLLIVQHYHFCFWMYRKDQILATELQQHQTGCFVMHGDQLHLVICMEQPSHSKTHRLQKKSMGVCAGLDALWAHSYKRWSLLDPMMAFFYSDYINMNVSKFKQFTQKSNSHVEE